MALERTTSIFNYLYLNENLSDSLKSQHFNRVSKVFIEYEDPVDLLVNFEESKFFYALDAIANVVQVTVYLPNEEQCDIFKLKTKRRLAYIQQLKAEREASIETGYTSEINSTIKNESDESMQLNDLKNSIGSPVCLNESSSNQCTDEEKEPFDFNSNNLVLCIDHETSSKMSSQSNQEQDLNKKISIQHELTERQDLRRLDQTNYDELDAHMIENHFKADHKHEKKATNIMETSLEDEGIGSFCSLSNNQIKCSSFSSEASKLTCSIINEDFLPVMNEEEFPAGESSSKLRNIFPDYTNIAEASSQGYGDFLGRRHSNYGNSENEEDDNDDETHLGDVVDRCDVDLAELDAVWNDEGHNQDLNNDSNILNDFVDNDYPYEDKTVQSNYAALYSESAGLDLTESNSSMPKKQFFESFQHEDTSDSKIPDSLNIFNANHLPDKENQQVNNGNKHALLENDFVYSKRNSDYRFIKSKLILNNDLGIRSDFELFF